MSLCTDFCLVNANQQRGTVTGLKCKRWQCSICQPLNRWKVMQLAKRGAPNLFMTLTVSHKKYSSPDEMACDMRRGLVLLRRKIADRWGVENIPFFVVFEKHKSGWPHMHLLLRGPYLHQAVLLGMWRSIMGDAGVNVKEIRKKEAVLAYVVKYIGKDLQKFEGCKRYWRSQNYEMEKEVFEKAKLYGLGYRRSRGTVDYFRMRLARDGCKIEKKGEHSFYFENGLCQYRADNWHPPWTDDRLIKPSLIAMAGA